MWNKLGCRWGAGGGDGGGGVICGFRHSWKYSTQSSSAWNILTHKAPCNAGTSSERLNFNHTWIIQIAPSVGSDRCSEEVLVWRFGLMSGFSEATGSFSLHLFSGSFWRPDILSTFLDCSLSVARSVPFSRFRSSIWTWRLCVFSFILVSICAFISASSSLMHELVS